MMSGMKHKRPTCEQLLINKSFWALNISDIENDVICKELQETRLNGHLIINNTLFKLN
jgi:hypothetical protein